MQNKSNKTVELKAGKADKILHWNDGQTKIRFLLAVWD